MTPKAFFVSDLHLQNMQDSRSRIFLEWLKSLHGPKFNGVPGSNHTTVSQLFWVGDIFDLWIADHRFFAKQFAPIIEEVKRLRLEGCEIHFFKGNHDLYLRPFWEGQIGITVHEGPALFDVGGTRVRVEHGDESDPTDRGYRFLRWFLRTPVLKWLALHLPEPLVVWLGTRASEQSRTYTSQVKTVSRSDARLKLHQHAERMAQAQTFDLLINGHVHVEDDYSFTVGDRRCRAINLGSWLYETRRILNLDASGVRFLDLN